MAQSPARSSQARPIGGRFGYEHSSDWRTLTPALPGLDFIGRSHVCGLPQDISNTHHLGNLSQRPLRSQQNLFLAMLPT
jgi:hypothetical protein